MAHKILAVDDHPETLSILVTTLKGSGYRVVSTHSPLKGLQLVESEKPDLLLVDMNMPDMNGIELVRRIRSLPESNALPIIMFSAETDTATKMAGFQAGVDDYITKPTDPAELIERVETLLQHIPDPDPENKLKQANSNAIGHSDILASLDPPPTVAEEGQLIALCGGRGGVGTTTIAINLAYMLSLMKHPTTLVDFDLQQGHIGLYLNQKAATGLNSVADLATEQLRQQLWQQRLAYRNNLHLLLTEPNMNGRRPTPNANEVTAVLETLVQPGQYVVADLGLANIAATQPVRDRADHIILCLPPERVALAAAKDYIEDIKSSIFFHTTLHVLICTQRAGGNLSQQVIEKFLNHPILTILPIQPQELAAASNKGIAIAQAFPKSPTMAALYKICLKLIPTPK